MKKTAETKGNSMVWDDDNYIRSHLDARERWGVLLSLTAAAGFLLFLSDHPHHKWLNIGPFLIGAFGSLFVFVVNCYHKQARDISYAETKEEKGRIRELKWHTFAGDTRFLGWLHILAPVIIGAIATLTLFYGLLSAPVEK